MGLPSRFEEAEGMGLTSYTLKSLCVITMFLSLYPGDV